MRTKVMACSFELSDEFFEARVSIEFAGKEEGSFRVFPL